MPSCLTTAQKCPDLMACTHDVILQPRCKIDSKKSVNMHNSVKRQTFRNKIVSLNDKDERLQAPFDPDTRACEKYLV